MPGLRERIGNLESRWTMVDGVRIHARVSVDPVPEAAPAVVLVHGAGISSRYMVPTAEWLAPFYRVCAPDLPGFGKSGKPPRVLTVPELAAALARWMEAVGLEGAALLGNSAGCQIVVDLAARHPDRVERLVLAGPTTDPPGRSLLKQVWRWSLNGRGEPRSLLAVVLRDYRDTGVGRVLRTFRYVLEDRVEEKLPRAQAPALVVRGSRDRMVPQWWAEEVARLLPNARLELIPGAAHTLNYNAPEALVRVVRPFLDDARRPAPGGR